MELCLTRALSTPSLQPKSLGFSAKKTPCIFRFNPFLPLKNPAVHFPGVLSHRRNLLRATSDDGSPVETGGFSTDRPDGVATLEDVPSVDNGVKPDDSPPVSQSVFEEAEPPKPADGESSSDESMQPVNDLLAKLNIKLDSEDPYTIFLYGGGALVALWLLSAIVGAVDSIPVFPKLMEVVGLGYSLWFTTRYLLFKKNREELAAKIEEIKREVLGSGDD